MEASILETLHFSAEANSLYQLLVGSFLFMSYIDNDCPSSVISNTCQNALFIISANKDRGGKLSGQYVAMCACISVCILPECPFALDDLNKLL